jgi:hypothetical protein
MPMKSPGRKTYKSMQGKAVDMDLLRQRNELTPAVGNMRVNARGDQLGPGGKIIRKREEILKDYYANQKGVPNEEPAVITKTSEIMAEQVTTTKKKSRTKDPLVVTEESWIEDADGNFVPKDA